MNVGSRVVAAAAALVMGFAGVVCLGQQGEPGLPKQSKPQPVAPGTDPLAAKPAGASSWPQDETVTADVKFNGGTVKEYVDALKVVYGDFNVVIDNNAMGMQTPEIRLTQVPKGEALKALELASMPQGGFPIIVEPRGAFYAVRVSIAQSEALNSEMTQVWSVKGLADDKTSAEDLLAAIDAAIGVGGSKATVRFHKETQLLICRARIDVLRTIENVLERVKQGKDVGGQGTLAALQQRVAALEVAVGKGQGDPINPPQPANTKKSN